MKNLALVISWALVVMFTILGVLTISLGRWVPAVPLFLAAAVVFPPLGKVFDHRLSTSIALVIRFVLLVSCVFGFLFLSFVSAVGEPLYASDDLREQLLSVYDRQLQNWPVVFEERWIETEYGAVYVITSGPEGAPPVVLLHAASMGSWSWSHNVGPLAADHRVFAIDYIGEPGKGRPTAQGEAPMNAEALSALYVELLDSLGIDSATIVGASFGGYIATRLALDAPGRVRSLALLGPMGLTPATSSVNLKLIAYTLLPLKMFQDGMVRWALGEDPEVLQETEEWFRLVLNGVTRKGPPPLSFTPDELKALRCPVLLILGDRDQLVGDPDAVRTLARNVPRIDIQVLNSAHLIGVEEAAEANPLLVDFLNRVSAVF